MGYYTKYTLEIDDFGETVPSCKHNVSTAQAKFCAECGKKIEDQNLRYYIEDYLKENYNEDNNDGYSIADLLENESQGMKWYDHEKQMREISKKFPTALFTLSGVGEETGDIWNEYYLKGKMQKETAEIVIDPFDKSKLV